MSVTKGNYSGVPRRQDLYGFCAAGVCLIHQGRVLMLREKRHNRVAYNFPGGKRDFVDETPWQVAVRELREEMTDSTGRCLVRQCVLDRVLSSQTAIWIGCSKFFLFCVHVDDLSEVETGVGEGGKPVEWVPLYDVQSRRLEVHPFAHRMATLIK